jgi:hypothetical protein
MDDRCLVVLLAAVLGTGLGGCSTDAMRERDVKGLLRCIQAVKDNCLIELSCTADPGAFSPEELLQLIPLLEPLDVEHLRLVGKDTRQGDTVYNFELDGVKLQVRFCPESAPGTIATLTFDP